ncbi:MAG TPA: hypothetical protein VFX77_02100, partial [Rubrobacter sp.]|nr:hypothetical protein [Rubrobacter sp.]
LLLCRALRKKTAGLIDDLPLHPAQELRQLIVLGQPGASCGRPAPFGSAQQRVERRLGLGAWILSVSSHGLDHLAMGSLWLEEIRYPSKG